MAERQYIMNEELTTVRLNVHPQPGKEKIVEHIFQQPTFDDEETKERMTPVIRKEGAKIEGTNAIIETVEDEAANLKFYNKLIKSVKGYKVKGSTEEIAVTEEIGDGKTVLDLIPSNHKITAILGMKASTFEVDLGDEDAEFEFELDGTSGSAGREWRIVQKIGGQYKREDGSMQPPDYEVAYVLREPTEKERANYKTKALNSQRWYSKKDNGMVERTSVNLKTLAELFDNLVLSVEGAVIAEGESLSPLSVKNAEHLGAIPASFKKTVVIRLLNALETDLGNS